MLMSLNINANSNSKSLFLNNFMYVFKHLHNLRHDNNSFDDFLENVRNFN